MDGFTLFTILAAMVASLAVAGGLAALIAHFAVSRINRRWNRSGEPARPDVQRLSTKSPKARGLEQLTAATKS